MLSSERKCTPANTSGCYERLAQDCKELSASDPVVDFVLVEGEILGVVSKSLSTAMEPAD